MNTKTFMRVAMIAAIYTVLSLVLAPLSFGPIQVRIAEGLTLLPLVYAPSIYGVTIGCFLTNLLGAITGANPTGILDSIVGTSATLLAALCTYYFRNYTVKGIPVLSILMPVIFNGIIIGIELGYILFPDNILMGSLTCGIQVAIGELVAVIIGYIIIKYTNIHRIFDEANVK